MNHALDFIFDRLYPIQNEGPWEWPPEIKLHVNRSGSPQPSKEEKAAIPGLGGAMCWDVFIGGALLSRWILDHPMAVRGKRVMDWGSGSGIVAIAAALAGAKEVAAIDDDPLAIETIERNSHSNGVADRVKPVAGNFLKMPCRGFDVITAAEIFYFHEKRIQEKLLEQAMQSRIVLISCRDDRIVKLKHKGKKLKPAWPFNFSAATKDLIGIPQRDSVRRKRLIEILKRGDYACRKLGPGG